LGLSPLFKQGGILEGTSVGHFWSWYTLKDLWPDNLERRYQAELAWRLSLTASFLSFVFIFIYGISFHFLWGTTFFFTLPRAPEETA